MTAVLQMVGLNALVKINNVGTLFCQRQHVWLFSNSLWCQYNV